MKKIILLVAIVSFLSMNMAIAGDGPAPNSGDGVSDGSGFVDKGAPNSGDGVSDGSGFDTVGDHGDGGDPCSDAGIFGCPGY